jgi:uncharacterized protein
LTTLFIDTSAPAKRYVNEIGTRWMRNQTRRSAGTVILIAASTGVEMYSLLARQRRAGSIAAKTAARLRRAFLEHIQSQYLVFPLDPPVLTRARALVTKHPLRTLDAIQLACALEAIKELGDPLTLISGDNNLLSAAAAEGIPTDNPYAHP